VVESLKELNHICQKANYKTKGNWYVRTILRDAALPVTWLLLHTGVTANQVTLVSLAIGLAGTCFLAIPGTEPFLTGVLLLQLWYFLDHVDGQIARYRKTSSLTGRFLDFLTHHIEHTTLFFALGYYGFSLTGSSVFVVWGFVTALSIMVFNVMHDVKYKTFFEKIEQDGGSIRKQGGDVQSRAQSSALKKFFSILHKLCEIHVMMNILTLAALIQIILKVPDLRIGLCIIYGLLAPVIATVKLFFILKNRKIDEEYKAMIHG
jgi:phosphatidylglycerophosphate synthase